MNRFNNLKICGFVLMALVSCQKLKPESVNIPEYPDFNTLLVQQIEILDQSRIRKEVWLEDTREVKVIEMDSAKWADELSFLKEVNPNQPEYVGAFMKSSENDFQVLTLGDSEPGPLKKVKFIKDGETYQQIQITLHEDKDVYVHHRNIEMRFSNGLLISLQISGYQKMMFKDTVRFGIDIEVN